MHEDFAVLLFFFGISMTANVALLISAVRSAARARRLERSLLPSSRTDEERVERIEQAVDSLTAQVDQMASTQEFLNRLVTDRFEKLARLAGPPPSDTPPPPPPR